ncbi:putative serine/threonine-protein kinase iks1 [Thoreauomyces humboldtii]|nr:putative serine/threonine-protein kinase iks1 [Thoreauomyces humboldtii]
MKRGQGDRRRQGYVKEEGKKEEDEDEHVARSPAESLPPRGAVPFPPLIVSPSRQIATPPRPMRAVTMSGAAPSPSPSSTAKHPFGDASRSPLALSPQYPLSTALVRRQSSQTNPLPASLASPDPRDAPESWTVVLHSPASRSAVLYDPSGRKLAVRRSNRVVLEPPRLHPSAVVGSTTPSVASAANAAARVNDACPLCGRSWDTPRSDDGNGHSHRQRDDAFVDAEYFSLLSLLAPPVETEPPAIEPREMLEDARLRQDPESLTSSSSSTHERLPQSQEPSRITDVNFESGLDDRPGSPAPGAATRNGATGLNESSFNQGYYDRFFVEERKLGRGLRGSVFLCQHVLDQVPLGQFAVKAIPVGTSHAWLVRMLREVHLLERLRHPNITEYKHAWLEYRQLTLFGPEVPCLFILMELANGGNLEEYIYVQWQPEPASESNDAKRARDDSDASDDERLTARERAVRIRDRRRRRLSLNAGKPATLHSSSQTAIAASPTGPGQLGATAAQLHGGIGRGPNGKRVRYLKTQQIWQLFLDVCNGLAHLHQHGIIHRDLKPPNLLLRFPPASSSSSGSPTSPVSLGSTPVLPRVLISDFGECEVLSDKAQRERTGATGTLEFMPPELLTRDSHGRYTPDHSPKADLWSLGVVLYFLCYADVPYSQTDDVDQLREEILGFGEVQFPDHGDRVSDELKDLIKQLMRMNSRERPDIAGILERYGHRGREVRGSVSTREATPSQSVKITTLHDPIERPTVDLVEVEHHDADTPASAPEAASPVIMRSPVRTLTFPSTAGSSVGAKASTPTTGLPLGRPPARNVHRLALFFVTVLPLVTAPMYLLAPLLGLALLEGEVPSGRKTAIAAMVLHALACLGFVGLLTEDGAQRESAVLAVAWIASSALRLW